jgi:ABC-type branched-subunit amino acid transport system substrate-binding protein
MLGVAVPDEVVMDPLREDVGAVAEKVLEKKPDAVVIWTSPVTAGLLMRALSDASVRAEIYLPQEAAAAISGERVAWTTAVVRDGGNFSARYRRATGVEASVEARETYDAVTITVRAIQVVGANRARVRDSLASVRNFEGASGRVSFDCEGNDRVRMNVVKVGQR